MWQLMNSLLEILQLYSWTENKINTHCTIISNFSKIDQGETGILIIQPLFAVRFSKVQ